MDLIRFTDDNIDCFREEKLSYSEAAQLAQRLKPIKVQFPRRAPTTDARGIFRAKFLIQSVGAD